MNKTSESDLDISKKILINTKELQIMLSCGRFSAVKVGEDARARIEVGKRVLWNRKKIEKYLGDIAD